MGSGEMCSSIGDHLAKASDRNMLDGEERKLGERTGLDTLVVLAVNDAR